MSTRQDTIGLLGMILAITVLAGYWVLAFAWTHDDVQDRRYSGPAEVVHRSTLDGYQLNACMVDNGHCKWVEVPRAIYEVAHEGTTVEMDKGAVVYNDNMRP